MNNLILGELVRFRTLALAFAVVHLIILRFSVTITPLFVQDAAKTSLGILSYALLGLIFGLYQMGSYRRPNLWAWLINRPLPLPKIFFALTTAAGLLALGVVALPLFLMTVYTDFLTGYGVDGRHYLMTFFLFGLVMSFYFLGCFIAARVTRAAVLVGVLPIFFLTREALGQWIFLPLLVVLIWLGYLAFSAFAPELDGALRGRVAQVIGALPIAYSVLFILSFAIVLARSTYIIIKEHGPLGFSTFAWNDYWEEGYVPHVDYLAAEDALAHGLRLGDSDRSKTLLAQLALSDVFELPGPRFSRFPRRHQPFFVDRRHELVDQDNDVRWTFSHDEMLFFGHEIRGGQPVGQMGLEGTTSATSGEALQPFPEVPFVVANQFLVSPRHIREVDLKRGTLDLRFELPEGEMFTSPFIEHRSFVVAKSETTLFFFDPRELKLGTGWMEPQLSVALPDAYRNISRILIAEMIDSYLVSFVVGSQSSRGYHDAYQRTMELPIGGGIDTLDGESHALPRVVADVPLAPGFPDRYSHRMFLMSPFLQHLHDVVWTAIGPHRKARVTWSDIVARPVPSGVVWGAVIIALLSAMAAAWLGHRRSLSTGDRRFWIVLAFILGIPGFVAFVVLARRDERREAAKVESSPRAMAAGLLTPRQSWSA